MAKAKKDLTIYVDFVNFFVDCPKCKRKNMLSGFPNEDGILIWKFNGRPVEENTLICETSLIQMGCGYRMKMSKIPQLPTSQKIIIEEK